MRPSDEYVHFPERALLSEALLQMAAGSAETQMMEIVSETGGGKTRLAQYFANEAGLPPHAAVRVRMDCHGPESLLYDLTSELEVGPSETFEHPNGTFTVPKQLPIEEAVPLLEQSFERLGVKLLLVDDAHNLHNQQSIPGRKWIVGYLTSLVRRRGISVALLTLPTDQPISIHFPNAASVPRHHLGLVGDSPQLRAWFDSIQQRVQTPAEGRLSDSHVVDRLIADNYGMLGFIESDAISLLIPSRQSPTPSAIADRLDDPNFRRHYLGPDDFRRKVYEDLRSSYVERV